jgi:predicted FMN-binding regulatory protein PaiB
MYIPVHFTEVSNEIVRRLIENDLLGCILAKTGKGLIANHIPLLLARDNTLIGHVALNNDINPIRILPKSKLSQNREERDYIGAL